MPPCTSAAAFAAVKKNVTKTTKGAACVASKWKRTANKGTAITASPKPKMDANSDAPAWSKHIRKSTWGKACKTCAPKGVKASAARGAATTAALGSFIMVATATSFSAASVPSLSKGSTSSGLIRRRRVYLGGGARQDQPSPIRTTGRAATVRLA